MSPVATAPRRTTSARTLLAVLIGGAIGTSARLALDAALPHAPDAFALSTLMVNVLGSFGLALAVATVWTRMPDWARAGLGAGVLGSFTTFSALAVSVVELARGGDTLAAVSTVGVTLVLGLLAALAGLALGARWSGSRPLPEPDEVDE